MTEHFLDHDLQDVDMLGEVELLGAVITAANDHSGRLSNEDLDDVLGLTPPSSGGTPRIPQSRQP